MKKIISFFLLILIPAFIFAGLDYKLELLSFKPTFTESSADRSRSALDFQYAVSVGQK